MRDGRVNRAIEKGRARTTDIKTRVPELRERMPELRERVPELTDGLRSRGGELARQYAKMDVSWARCSYAKAARAALLGFGLGPMIDYYVRTRVVGGEVFDRLSHPVIFVANHSSHLDTPTILRALPRKWRRNTAVAAAADYFVFPKAGEDAMFSNAIDYSIVVRRVTVAGVGPAAKFQPTERRDPLQLPVRGPGAGCRGESRSSAACAPCRTAASCRSG